MIEGALGRISCRKAVAVYGGRTLLSAAGPLKASKYLLTKPRGYRGLEHVPFSLIGVCIAGRVGERKLHSYGMNLTSNQVFQCSTSNK